MERKEYVIAEGLLRESVRTNNEIGIPLDKWYIDNGYQDHNSKWNFPPLTDDSEE